MTEATSAAPKRPRSAEPLDESSDDEMGPMPVQAGTESAAEAEKSKRRKTLQYERLYLDQLPSADRYYKSLMHRDTINFVSVTPHTAFVVTTSIDGHVKFWKKQTSGVEFV